MRPGYGAVEARAAGDAIRHRINVKPRVGIILGSGLGGIAQTIEEPVRMPYRDIPGFPSATIAGHAGELVTGILGGTPVAAMSGRFHLYEGHSADLTGFPVRVLHALGAAILIVSNAAGGVRASLAPGTLMLITDHINFMFRNPLVGPLQAGDTRFPDMSEPYDPALRAVAQRVAKEQGLDLAQGVYAAELGPSYETGAEVAMLTRLGADAVGMSTVPEVIVARALGMRVLGLSCITNLACGLSATPITHDEVLETTAKVAARLQRLVRGIVSSL
ncbi:MAG TPA: purine-nucleoside phosphorylase [Gemmatimonadaceae bacterium]|nr:purine-nucleoside phosphorylase [Gemmatimonadaceae bacterium]